MGLCETFKDLACMNWLIIRQSRLVGFQLKEESLTDFNVLNLKLRHPEVETTTFSKWDEGLNGADWEWWFTDGAGRWIGFRVQAKVLDICTGNFEHLYYQKDKSSLSQCDKLIAAAASDTAYPCYPLYAFYVHDEDLPDQPHLRAGLSRELYGCSLVSAYEVRSGKLARKPRSLSDWQGNIWPWHELVCHSPGRNLISHLASFGSANLGFPQGRFMENYILPGPPAYVNTSGSDNGQSFVSETNPHGLAGAVTINGKNNR